MMISASKTRLPLLWEILLQDRVCHDLPHRNIARDHSAACFCQIRSILREMAQFVRCKFCYTAAIRTRKRDDDNFVNVSHFLVIINWFIPPHRCLIDAYISVCSMTLTRVWWWCFTIRNTEFNNQPGYEIEVEWGGPSIWSSCCGKNNDGVAKLVSDGCIFHLVEERSCRVCFWTTEAGTSNAVQNHVMKWFSNDFRIC